MSNEKNPQRKNISMVDHVMNRVKKSIVNGSYSQGEKLPTEAEWMDICATSRSSVREAMKILSALGIIEIRRGCGTFVAGSESRHLTKEPYTSPAEMPYTRKELMDYREVIECALLDLLIRNQKSENINILESCNSLMKTEMEGDCDRNRLLELDIQFHLELGKCCENSLMEALNRNLMEMILPHLKSDYQSVQYIGFISYVNHQQIVDSLRYGDNEMAHRTITECKKTFFAMPEPK